MYIDDRTMVYEENCGYINGEPDKKTTAPVKKHQEEGDELGIPSIEEMMEQLGIPTEKQKQLLEHDIPLPSNVNYGSMTEEEIESLVPSVAEIMEEMLKHPEKGKPSIPTVEADGLPSVDQIAAAMGVKLPKEGV